MNITGTIETSWELMKHSLGVIRANPRLALFPVVSGVCITALALFFLAPLIVMALGSAGVQALLHGMRWPADGEKLKEVFGWMFYTYGAVIYVVSLFAAAFFNVAFYNEILRALAGEPVSVRNGLKFAGSRVRAIAAWSLLAGTVGLLIRAVEERMGWLGKIVMAFVGIAWSVAAVFAIPVIVRNGETNPFTVLRASAGTLKQTWGESLTGFVGIKLAGLVVALAMILGVAVVAVAAILTHSAWVAVPIAMLWLLGIFAAAFLIGLATHVYRCALYVYASEGVVPEPYTAEMMDAGWKIKKA